MGLATSRPGTLHLFIIMKFFSLIKIYVLSVQKCARKNMIANVHMAWGPRTMKSSMDFPGRQQFLSPECFSARFPGDGHLIPKSPWDLVIVIPLRLVQGLAQYGWLPSFIFPKAVILGSPPCICKAGFCW